MMDRTKETASHLRDRMSDGTSALGDRARHFRDRLGEGTEGMSEEARRRIETARRKALQMGDYRDQLFDEAEAVYQDEKGRLESAVSAGLDEAKSAASNVVAAAKGELTDDHSEPTSSGLGSSHANPASGVIGTSGTA